MNEYFIQNIVLKNVRNISNLEIPLSQDERKHLIITGKNGCGKTSTLREINNLLMNLLKNEFKKIDNYKKNIVTYTTYIKQFEHSIEAYKKNIKIQEEEIKKLDVSMQIDRINQFKEKIKKLNSNIINQQSQIKSHREYIENHQKEIDNFSTIDLIFANQNEVYQNIVDGKFLLAFFEAKRETRPNIPQTPTKQNFQPKYATTPELSKTFLQYMVNLKTTQAFAQIRKDDVKVKEIGTWFDNFENSLKSIFSTDALKLVFYDEKFNFKIEYDNKSFGLNELSDGYSSILSIVTELILRMDSKEIKAYDMQGIVLIDEIETHLHVDLQKKILPFLASFFPKIQFIVTTHSPFVLSSLPNAVICDLEKKFITTDLTGYSYESLVDSYFDTDKYSIEVKQKLKRFEELTLKDNENLLVADEFKEYIKLEMFFENIPKYQNEEIAFHFNRIQQLKEDIQ